LALMLTPGATISSILSSTSSDSWTSAEVS
jgi:hypothetical protein